MLAGPDTHIYFTHLSKPSCQPLTTSFQAGSGSDLAGASCCASGMLDLIKNNADIGKLTQHQYPALFSPLVTILGPLFQTHGTPMLDNAKGMMSIFLFGCENVDT